MSAKGQPPRPVLKLKTLNKGLRLAEQWVKNMPGQAGEEPGQLDMEGRPAGLGLGARVLPKSHLGPSNDPLERKLMRHLGVGKKKPVADEERKPPARNGFDSDDDEENLESRTNAFTKKRAGSQLLMPPSNKKSNR
ncbi:hypothetical protein KSS87_016459 [Heliosperma pusillum]|nr:hypothetical protein KSS87_016459 [Heliosperma pusillum]